MKIKNKKKNQTKKEHQAEVAIKLWDDYYQRIQAYSTRLRKDLQHISLCFGIEENTLEDARHISLKTNQENLGRII